MKILLKPMEIMVSTSRWLLALLVKWDFHDCKNAYLLSIYCHMECLLAMSMTMFELLKALSSPTNGRGTTQGFLSSINCMRVKNCLVVWKVKISRGDHASTTRMLEAVA